MLDAVAPPLNGETKAGGIGKFGVFRLGVNVVVQLQLTGSQHHHML